MSDIKNGGPAFPFVDSASSLEHPGMTLRQYAAIKLRVPASGTDWLDEMIRASLRDEMAAKAMPVLLADVLARQKDIDDGVQPSDQCLADSDETAELAYWTASAMLRARDAT